jgi:hypothetical protein
MEWISVEDRLPEIYDFVLVFADKKGTNEPRPIGIARIVINHSEGHRYSDWELLGDVDQGAYQDMQYEIYSSEITHWMNLPSPPKE